MTTLSDRLARLQAGFFVGRQNERERFAAFLQDTGATRFLHVQGPGGIGKSTLLRRFMQHCTDENIPCSFLDARQVNPTPGDFLAHVRSACGLPEEADLFAFLQRPGLHVLVLDTYEVLSELDPWLREHFFPRLGDSMRIVIGARQYVSDTWRTDPAWRELSAELLLRHFSREESRQFLALYHLPEDQQDEAARLSYGNPLVLSLMAQVLRDHPDADLRSGLPVDMAYQLTERLLDMPDDARYVTALQVSCLVRATNEDVLASILGAQDARDIFAWLADLSFMRWTQQGLVPHDLVRGIVVRDLKTRLPSLYEDLLHRCRHQVLSRILASSVSNRQRYMEDLFFLLRDTPAWKMLFGGHYGDELYVDDSRPHEVPEVLAAIEQNEGKRSAESARYWLDQRGTTLTMTRNSTGRWVGFVLFLRLDHRSTPDPAWDPVVHAMWSHIQDQGGLREGEVARLGRFWMSRDQYQTPGPVQTRLFQYITLQHFVTPGLAFLACSFAYPDQWPLMFQIRRLADSELEGTPYGWLGYNWRELSQVQWLENLTGDFDEAPVGELSPAPEQQVFALERSEFDTAVRAAFRHWRQPDRLVSNPLLQSRLVLDRARPEMTPAERTTVLRDLLAQVVERFPGAELDDRPRRVLQATWLEPAAKQTAVAASLQLPFSTYRYHLSQAMQRVCDILWQLELGASSSDIHI